MSQLANEIHAADTPEFWFITAIVFALVAAAYYFGFVFLKRKRIIQDTPTALMRSAPQGYVELNGEARLIDGAPIVAPLTGKICVWYRYKVEEKQRGVDRRRSTWRIVDQGISDALFYLVDPTGHCVINPDGAEVITTHNDTWHGRNRRPGLSSYGSRTSFLNSYRYTERRIEVGDPLYAIGNLRTHGGARTSFDKKAQTRDLLREWKRDRPGMLARFDSDRNGEIDMHEWRQVTTAAEIEVLTERDRVIDAPAVDMLGATGDSWHPFVISNIPEHKLEARYHWRSIGLMVFALLGSTALFWALSVRLAA